MLTFSARGVLLAGLLAAAVSTVLLSPARREASGTPAAGGQSGRTSGSGGGAVQAQMRNVDYHVIPAAVLNIRRLRGELHSKVPGKPPVFDDKDSFFMTIHSAEIGMTDQSMAGLFNEHVFAYPGSPLEKIEVHIEPDGVTQKGVLAERP